MKRSAFLSLIAAFVAVGCGGAPVATPSASTQPSSSTHPSDRVPSTRPILGLPAGWELAPKANYAATQTAGVVTIKATGENPTAGYEVKLYQSPLRIYPPQWMLAHKKPDGFVAQVITPFDVTASFKADQPIKQVIVSDAAGRHTVTVEQAAK